MKKLTVETVSSLIDFEGNDPTMKLLADAQLKAATRLYNILCENEVCYLADEVGMGKTYVTLGLVSLLRYFDPRMRVLYIAPSANIQQKWQKEYINFLRNNYKAVDHYNRTFNDKPAAPFTSCENLLEFAGAVTSGYYRDYFLRLTSFSLPMSDDEEDYIKKEQQLKKIIPGRFSHAPRDNKGNYNKEEFKFWFIDHLHMITESFDLVVVDEAHNLKGGPQSGASRNQLIHRMLCGSPGHKQTKIRKLCLLSATPYDQNYTHLVNQLEVFGATASAVRLTEAINRGTVAAQREIRKFLVRRLNRVTVGQEELTRNMYRSEYRDGGLQKSEPLAGGTDLQRLVVALVQKKVAQLLGDSKFNGSFQMGMLASFESFFQTSKTDYNSFDSDQAVLDEEREGADVNCINRLTRSFHDRFDRYLPHPKMDAVVKHLKSRFRTGEKVLIFVRRIHTVPELTNKLGDAYDGFIIESLKEKFRQNSEEFSDILNRFYAEKKKYRIRGNKGSDEPVSHERHSDEQNNDNDDAEILNERLSLENFFTWFFVEESDKYYFPKDLKNTLNADGQPYSTVFEENYATLLLGDDPLASLKKILKGRDAEKEFREQASAVYHRNSPKREVTEFIHARSFDSAQIAVLKLIASGSDRNKAEVSRRILDIRYNETDSLYEYKDEKLIPNVDRFIMLKTFFSSIRDSPVGDEIFFTKDYIESPETFRSAMILRSLIAAVIRLGSGMIDLYSVQVENRGGFKRKTGEKGQQMVDKLVQGFIKVLEEQSRSDQFNTFKELKNIKQNLQLIIKVNFPEVYNLNSGKYKRYFAARLKEQSPVAGMYGSVNKNSVLQFRMPGYPFILIATDVLQEGEDLHTFCADVIHYGISWTATAIEQKTGRIDRIGSLTSRRLSQQKRLDENSMLNVYFPYLKETIEVYQMRRLFYRMNDFVDKLHNYKGQRLAEDSTVNISREVLNETSMPEPVTYKLTSPFDITAEDLIVTDGQPEIRKNDDYIEHFEKLLRQLEDNSSYSVSYSEDNRHKTAIVKDSEKVCELELVASRHTENLLLTCRSTIHRCEPSVTTFSDLLDLHTRPLPARLVYDGGQDNRSSPFYVESGILFGSVFTQPEEVTDLVNRVTGVSRAAESFLNAENFTQNYRVKSQRQKIDQIIEIVQDKSFNRRLNHYGIESFNIMSNSTEKIRLKLNFKERFQLIDMRKQGDYIFILSQGTKLLRNRLDNRKAVQFSMGRNNHVDVIDFFFNIKGSLFGRIWQPVKTIQIEELAFYCATLAHEMDRLEFALYKKDTF